MKFYLPMKTIIFSIAIAAWVAIPFSTSFISESSAADVPEQCPSGYAQARLTGWRLNNQTPRGTADFNETTRTLTVSVESVGLPDGRILLILLGDDRIGQLSPLKDGQATGTVTRDIPAGARIRVFDEDRPIVSANLQCAPAPAAPAIVPTSTPVLTPYPTATPTQTPTPGGMATPTPTPSPSPTVSPSPTGEPTPDPMPKQSPAPSPSPAV